MRFFGIILFLFLLAPSLSHGQQLSLNSFVGYYGVRNSSGHVVPVAQVSIFKSQLKIKFTAACETILTWTHDSFSGSCVFGSGYRAMEFEGYLKNIGQRPVLRMRGLEYGDTDLGYGQFVLAHKLRL